MFEQQPLSQFKGPSQYFLPKKIGTKEDAPFHENGGREGDSDNMKMASIAEASAVTMRSLILVGFILLFVNVCSCTGVFYQKYQVRHRETRLLEELKVITELLVSEEQPQLAHHVANVMKQSDRRDKTICKITMPGTFRIKVIKSRLFKSIMKIFKLCIDILVAVSNELMLSKI